MRKCFPFPNYRVVDYSIEAHYAPERDLRRMVDRAHRLGLKVLLDVVMHGVVAEKGTAFCAVGSASMANGAPRMVQPDGDR